MAIESVQAVAAPALRTDASAQKTLAALAAGQTLPAAAIGQSASGDIRLALLDIFLDIVSPSTINVGDKLTLTVLETGDRLMLAATPQLAAAQGDEPPATILAVDMTAQDGFSAQEESTATGVALQRHDQVALSGIASRFAVPVAQAATPDAPLLSAPEREAVAQMLPQAAAGQRSLVPLLANAGAALASGVASALPPAVRDALAALTQVGLDAGAIDAPALKQAVAQSGLFQEAAIARLATTSDAATPPNAAAADAAPHPAVPAPDDPKTLLLGDLKTILLTLRTALGLLSVGAAADDSPAGDIPAPPVRGTPSVPQRAAEATLSAQATPREAAATLAAGMQGGLDRLRLLQIASLAGAQGSAAARDAPRFDRITELVLRLPDMMATPGSTAASALPGQLVPGQPMPGQTSIMSLAIGRDGGGGSAAGEAPAWRMQLSLDLEPSGPMHALVSLRGTRAGVTLWAERPETADLFRGAIGELRDALTVADLDVETLEVRTGSPPEHRAAAAGTFLDRRS